MSSNIVYLDAPPIIGLSFTEEDGWLYETDGHYMSVYGVNSDKSEFALADPWIGYSGSGLNNKPWSYAMDSSIIYKAYNSSSIGLMC